MAALHVVVFHTFHADWLPPRLLRPITWGSASTSLLFLLSGFILAYTYAGGDGRLRIPRREFLWRRATRMVPLNVGAHLLTIPLVWHAYPQAERAARAAVSLLALQAWLPRWATSFNSPGWSVSALLFCYVAFPAVLAAVRGWTPRRAALAFAALWATAAAIPAAYLAWGGGDAFWYSLVNHLPPVRMLEFLMGVVLARACRAGWEAPAWSLPVGLAGWLVAVVALPNGAYLLVHNGLLAPFHALVLLGLARRGGPRGAVVRLLEWRPVARLGDASFAIFLLHVPLYSWTILPLAPWLDAQPAAVRWGAYAAYLAGTVSVSWAADRWVGTALSRRLRASTGSGAVRRDPAPAVASVEG